MECHYFIVGFIIKIEQIYNSSLVNPKFLITIIAIIAHVFTFCRTLNFYQPALCKRNLSF